LNGGMLSYRQPRSIDGSSSSTNGGSKSRLVNGKETLKGAWPWQVSNTHPTKLKRFAHD